MFLFNDCTSLNTSFLLPGEIKANETLMPCGW